jgi:hypothetical protein
MTIFARFALVLCAAIVGVAPVYAQSPGVPAPAPTLLPRSTAVRSTTRTVSAVIVAVDGPARTISLRLATNGAPVTADNAAAVVLAVQDVSCRPLKGNRDATLADFAVGETVVARLTWRTAPEPIVVLRDLYDAASYAERQRQGKEICVGTVDQFTAAELSVKRADGVVIAFRVSDKTKLVKNDGPATLAAFPAGEPIAVKPRRLPSGDLQAAIVGGGSQEVAWAYRDGLTTWTGSVIGVQGDERTGAVISLHREDGAKRQFLLPLGATFKQGRSLLPWRLLPGATISAHLVKTGERNGMRYSDGVKIVSRRTRKTADNSINEP